MGVVVLKNTFRLYNLIAIREEFSYFLATKWRHIVAQGGARNERNPGIAAPNHPTPEGWHRPDDNNDLHLLCRPAGAHDFI